MNLNRKLSKKTTIIAFLCIAIFVGYVFHIAYGIQKTIDSYKIYLK